MNARLDRLPRIVRLSLINFYLIDREDIAIDGNTAFLGPNRSGKSSNIDAIQTALTGGRSGFSVFNAAAVRQNRPDAHRSLREYCLGVVQHDENEKARVMRKNSLTWIALSFRKDDGAEVAGVVQVNANEARERVDTRFMIVTGGGITTSDLVFSGEDGAVPKTFAQAMEGLRAIGREVVECDSATDYSDYLLNLLTYGSWHADADGYFRAVCKALVFQPVGDITDFMRRHILEAEPIDIGRMRERLAFYREIVRTIENIRRQIESLGGVVAEYSAAAEADREARGRVAAATEAAVVHRQADVATRETELERLHGNVETCKEAEEDATRHKDEAFRRVEHAKNANGNDILETRIREKEGDVSKAEVRLREVRKELRQRALAIDDLRTAVGYMPDSAGRNVRKIADFGADFRRSVDDAEIESVVSNAEALQRIVEEVGAAALRELQRARTEAARREGEIRRTREDLMRRAKSEAIDHAVLSDEAEALRDELEAAKIKAAPLCDLIDVREGQEEWRNAVESVLGNSREAMILMEAGRYLDAIREQRKSSRSAGIQIVKPKVLDDNPRAPENSLAAVIEAENATARAFVNAFLGQVKRVRTEIEIEKESNAVTSDMMRATRYASYKMRPQKYLLVGRRGREQAVEAAKTELQRLFGEEREATKEREVYDAAWEAYKVLVGQASGPFQVALGSVVDELQRAKTTATEMRKALGDLSIRRDPAKAQQILELESERKKLEETWSKFREATRQAEKAVDDAERDLSDAQQALAAAILERDAKALPEHDVAHAVRLRVLGLLNGARDFWREHRQTLETAKTREDESLAARERGHEAWATHVTAFPDVPMPHLSTEAWRERLLESRAMRDQLENSTLLSKTAEAEDAGRQLSEAFRNEFLSLLVHAFSKIRDTRDDLNRDMERHQFYGEKYVFRMTQVDRFSPIINLVQRATEDPNWTMPLVSMLGDETEEGLAIRTIADMIENNDEKGLSDLRDPKAYWTFDVLVKDPVTNATVSTMAARMKKGSIGEGSVPQYIAMAAAVSSKASSPDRSNGSLGVILLDDALSGLDAEHFVKMLKFISDAGLQIIAAAPDAQSREWAHGMDTFINVSREGNDIYLVHETVSDELREELAEADPRIKGYQAYRARTVERDRGDLMEVAE
jgi:putative exonuclease SbcCD C subunit/AAA domain-containing protein